MSNLEQLLVDMKESLEHEIHAGFQRVDTRFDEVNARFDVQAARLKRHGALLQTGSRWSNGMNVWMERIDTRMEAKNREIVDLRTRLERLEKEK